MWQQDRRNFNKQCQLLLDATCTGHNGFTSLLVCHQELVQTDLRLVQEVKQHMQCEEHMAEQYVTPKLLTLKE